MSESRTYEFQIDGRVSTRRLLHAFEGWASTLYQIGIDLGINLRERNEVANLSGGSAMATFEVHFPSQYAADQFSDRFSYIMRVSRHQESIDVHTRKYLKAAKKFRSAATADISGSLPGMVWRSQNEDYVIDPETDSDLAKQLEMDNFESAIETFGVIEGKLQSLNARNGVRAVVYDVVFDRAVAFSIPEGFRADISTKWDKPVEVVGVIRRDPVTGRPLSIVDVSSIDLIDESVDEDAWRKAIGVLSDVEPDVLPEVMIRRLRDHV